MSEFVIFLFVPADGGPVERFDTLEAAHARGWMPGDRIEKHRDPETQGGMPDVEILTHYHQWVVQPPRPIPDQIPPEFFA